MYLDQTDDGTLLSSPTPEYYDLMRHYPAILEAPYSHRSNPEEVVLQWKKQGRSGANRASRTQAYEHVRYTYARNKTKFNLSTLVHLLVLPEW